MAFCQNCGKELPQGAKFCSNCGAPIQLSHPTQEKNSISEPSPSGKKTVKQSKKKSKGWVFIVAALVIVFIMFSRSASSSPEKTTTTTSSVSAAAKPSPTPIEYTEMDVIQLLGALKTNALAAKEAYQNQYVSLTGKLSNIDADGKYISLSANTDGYEYMFDSIHCSIKTDEIKKAVMDMRVGDIITVKGKITDVGEVLGYYLTIDQFG